MLPAQGVTVTPGGDVTDNPAPMPDRFVVVEQGLRVQQPELQQAPLQTLFALPEQTRRGR